MMADLVENETIAQSSGDGVLIFALNAAKQGLPVFPCLPNQKTPAFDGGHNNATTDEATIREWWRKNPNLNYGITPRGERINPATKEVEHLIVIDVDRKNGKDGLETLSKACDRAGLTLDDLNTYTVKTPNNGLHLYFWTTKPIRQGVDVIGAGVDTRTEQGYVLGAGSSVDGKKYQVEIKAPISPMGALADQFPIKITPPKMAVNTAVAGVDKNRAEKRAIEYLIKAPHAIEGAGGDVGTFKVAARLKDMGCTEAQAFDLMAEYWNDRCLPPWGLNELQAKVTHAYKYGTEPQGVFAPEAVFEKVEAPDSKGSGASVEISPLEQMNATHAYVLINGTGYILWETVDEKGRPTTEIITLPTFHQLNASASIQFGNRTQPLTQAWMTWEHRRTYKKIVMAAGKNLPTDFYNLWRGFAIEPKKGDWSYMRQHIKDVICGGDPSLNTYVIGWLARMVQKPSERAEVALVLKGLKGVGKGTLGHWLLEITGRHGVHISNANHLVGKFNAHLRDAIFLFADEAFWAGDKQHESVLKSIITEPTVMVEAKGRDAMMMDNCLHILMASNADWIVPVTGDERRYCVIDVSAQRKRDWAYFDKIEIERKSGGLAAMLYDLLALDLRGFNIRDIPKTKALGDQKLFGLKGAERWLYEGLTDGVLAGQFWKDDAESLPIQKAQAYEDYCNQSRRAYGEYRPADKRLFWRLIKKALGNETGKLKEERVGKDRTRLVIFGNLTDSRRAFSAYLDADIEWGTIEEERVGSGIAETEREKMKKGCASEDIFK